MLADMTALSLVQHHFVRENVAVIAQEGTVHSAALTGMTMDTDAGQETRFAAVVS